MKAIRIACKGAETADYLNLNPFQGDLKDLTDQSYQKLRKEILERGFSFAIHVWKNKGKLYVLDGHQRLRTVRQMVEKEGYGCPELPIVPVEAKSLKEAKLKVLSGTSQYGEMSSQGLYEFMTDADIGFDEMQSSFKFDRIDFDHFNSEFFTEPKSAEGEEDEDVDVQPIIFSLEQIGQQAYHYFRKAGFPYPTLELHEQMQELNKLASMDGPSLLTSRVGYRIADSYHKHRFHAAAVGMKSPYDSFQDNKKLKKAIDWHLESSGSLATNFFGALSLVSGTQACSNFRPAFAKHLYDTHCPEGGAVFDSSTGYGGRLIGFLASKAGTYYGTDPNVPTFKANEEIKKALGKHKKIELFNSPIEDLDVKSMKNKCDFAFTSPPYFIKETYSLDKTQSCQRYKGYEQWLKGFLKPMLQKQFDVLKKGSINIVNIEDVKIAGETYKLVDPTVKFAEEIGFKFDKIERFTLPNRTAIVEEEKQTEAASESVIVLKRC